MADGGGGPAHFSFVAPNVAGSSKPGNFPNTLDKDIHWLRKEHNIRAILSLSENALETTEVLRGELIEAHLQLAMADYKGFEHPETMMEACEFIHKFVENDKGVLVHCNAGMGRTGTVLAAYRLAKGLDLDADSAVATLRRLRRGSVQTNKQHDSIREFETWLREHRRVPLFQ